MRLLPLNATAREDDDEDDDVESPHQQNVETNPDDDDDDGSAAFDTGVVKKAVADAGQHAYGIVMVEVWLLSQDQTRLYRPGTFGAWIDPVFEQSSDDATRDRLARLNDPSRSDHIPAGTLSIGEGLAGLLWVEAKNLQHGSSAAAKNALMRMRGNMMANRRRQSELNLQASGAGGGDHGPPGEAVTAPVAAPEASPSSSSSAVFFRNVNQISSDPDQPFSPRLKLIAEIGLGWCAAVPLPSRNAAQGIVLFLARNHVSLHRLQSPSNQQYLVAATKFVGAALDLRQPRRVAELARKQQVRDAWRRVRDRLVYLKRMGVSLADAVAESENHHSSMRPDLRQSLQFTLATTKRVGLVCSKRLAMMLKKGRGGDGMPPPAMSAFQACYTFVGAFVTLCLLHAFNQWLSQTYNAGIALGYAQINPIVFFVALT
jgi:hypothetical protein